MLNDSLELNGPFQDAFNALENSTLNFFLTGKAGTGKSTLLQYFRHNTTKNVAVLAPTGVAAVNVSGQTIHSFFRFKPDITPDTVKSIKLRGDVKKLYASLDTVIIDEISMVRADLLDCIDHFLRLHGPRKSVPFGGVQMILFGDLYQLPPVVTAADKNYLSGIYDGPYFFNAKCINYLDLKLIELEKIYRQREEDFIDLLNGIRDNTLTHKDLNYLNTRHQPEFIPRTGELFIYLTTTNALADKINQQQLDVLRTRPFCFQGEVEGKFEERNLPTQWDLNLKYGAQVMLLNNDPEGRWINGSIGKIISVEDDEDVICVELNDGERVDVTPYTWEMFRFNFDEESESVVSEVVGTFRQFPLKLAWAVTIHKSQGQTFDRVVLDIGNGTFAHGQAYVALSRCTSFDGLVLKKPIQKNHIMLDERVVQFMKDQRAAHHVESIDIVDSEEKISHKERLRRDALKNVKNLISK